MTSGERILPLPDADRAVIRHPIEPTATRAVLLEALAVALRYDDGREFKTGVMQV